MSRLAFSSEWPVDSWYGFRRHHFSVDGCPAWIVEPDFPVPDNRWSWCTQWAEAFVQRVGTTALLSHGFYHAHVDVYAHRGSPEGVRIMKKFKDTLVGLGLSEKANLIGLSWGGFFSLRYATEHPEDVQAIYLDAPVCNADDEHPSAAERLAEMEEQFGMPRQELRTSPLNPLNAVDSLVKAGIPIFAVIGGADNVVVPENNFDLLEERLQTAGAKLVPITGGQLEPVHVAETFATVKGATAFVYRRPPWAHHPHGLDDTAPLLYFHWNSRE